MDHQYRFGPFYVDTRERLLLREGEHITLKQKAVDVLLILLRESPRIVEKEQFMSEVWRDAFVEEGSLTVSVSEIRKALGVGPEGRQYIETIPRRGYRFTPEPWRSPLEAEGPPATVRASAAEAPPARSTARAVAVLPFANLSSDGALDYLADGFADSIINSLSRLSGLRVKASGSSFRYRGIDVDCQLVGRDLGVGAVVSGRILQLRDRLVVRVALVDATDGAQLWGEQYDRKPSDLLEVQGEIAGEVAGQLQLRLTGEEQHRLAKLSTESVEAYRAYLKGRSFWSKRPQPGFLKGIEYFRRAIEFDPGYALAYSGLADAYGVLGSWEVGMLPPREAAAKARAAAIRALEIDDQLAEAHTSLAHINLHYDWDWTVAEGAFKRALELSPSYVHAHHWYSHLCVATGRTEQGYAAGLRALELDPLDLIINVHMAWHHWLTREPALALEQCARGRELEPASPWWHLFGGLAYEQKEMYAEAIEELRRAAELSDATKIALAGLGHAAGLALERDEAERVLSELERLSGSKYVPAYDRAVAHLGLGDTGKALEYLTRACDERSSWMPYLNVEPRLDPLRSDPRFQELVRRVGLPQ
ncbi:MAG TPA: winged helix-turn-helix domain-containing protein [Pyrinomonadaceae bacterium]